MVTAVSDEIRIERAGVAEAAGILELQRIAYRSEARLYDDWSIPPLVQSLLDLAEQIRSEVVLKAVAGQAIVGSVRGFVAQRTGHIGRLMVLPAFRHRGIGTALMRAIEGTLAGVDRFELFTGERSLRNVELYRRLGYEVFRTQAVSTQLTLVYMQKTADPERSAAYKSSPSAFSRR